MICKPCRQGAVEAFTFGNKRTAEHFHGACTGLCDCQHDTSQSALNTALVSTTNKVSK